MARHGQTVSMEPSLRGWENVVLVNNGIQRQRNVSMEPSLRGWENHLFENDQILGPVVSMEPSLRGWENKIV